MFSKYFENNSASIWVDLRRALGGDDFQIGGHQFVAPMGCFIDSEAEGELILGKFLCAVDSKKIAGVEISKPPFNDVETTREYVEEYFDRGAYVQIKIGARQGGEDFFLYYLKRQNLVISSDYSELSMRFVKKLFEYDFRIND